MGAVIAILLISLALHSVITWLGKRAPAIVYFIEDFSGTILLYCILTWVGQADNTDKQKPSMLFAYTALYFFFVFISKISRSTLYEEIPTRNNRISLLAEFSLFIASAALVRIINLATGSFLLPEKHTFIYLMLVIATYYIMEKLYIKHSKTKQPDHQKS
ncbi:hypothetical protein PPUJ20028_32890 [Pseudomonas putida]|uniref:Uncharacterized protein n=1 Tax=Pseudomonas putida TaxID=303 RepID=A0AA37RAU2_PSEPU|nr:hypothetical protein [Pseudomonas putida]GLO14706.1 hypothetical protein PPUJ20028_32890 [Pseudomonas putida]GLO34927.1 hypothetical protein PPUN14671_17600 [Pseudomonas putida]HDS0963590.1 hypothetical protein [Pseudomonas putida]HDS0988849.1 hypothetical protein [Pseudomonas putida]